MKKNSSLNNQLIVGFYREMLLIRFFEEKIEYGFSRDQIYGTTHLCIGQEAVPVGISANLTNNDYVVSTHRGHGHALSKGLSPKRLMAEIMGKADGYCQGKGGTQHVASVDKGFLGTNGITGGGIPVATGAAFTIKYKARNDVSVCYFGDGATNQGTFHESLNMASIWKLPIIYICENNFYGMSTHSKTTINNIAIADRAKSFGIEGYRLDGMDVIQMYEDSKKIIEKVRSGAGPVLLECETYRFKGHSKSDPRIYRSRDEEKEWRKKCAILNLKKKMIREEILGLQALTAMENEVKSQIEDAYTYALELDVLPEKHILKDIFYE